MRKLTVKNFSVIKEAELEFGKITVLIGPQSSGKSLLCKLAYFFQVVVPEVAEESIRKMYSLDGFRLSLADQLVNTWFPDFGPEPHAEITYEDGEQYRVSVHFSRHGTFSSGITRSVANLSLEIESCYEAVRRRLGHDGNGIETHSGANALAREVGEALRGIQGQGSEVYSYIPSTRSFFVTLQKALFGTSGRNDPIALRFSNDFNLDFAKRVPLKGLQHELYAWISGESSRILSGEVEDKGTYQVFKSKDGREVALSFLSSGTQELLPLLTCLREFVALSAAVAKALDLGEALHRRLFFIEEPETSIFPTSQYDLVRIFARMANESILDVSWVITTHSPYILSSFTNLLEAWQVGHMDAERANRARKVVDEEYWVNPTDFRAYAIKDGILKSIVAEDTQLIDANFLDEVSETTGAEFDELLRIGYVDV